ncbi:MAG TPA: zf-TFIIB domain-containing protein [Oligoflexia bacterium]|nr:zf-TFIIB domain-containing protein [Oligoflexia bacterium]HMP47974.1 zf-TFIIB domain-containing protein [Oligoflexia bacterium]
MTLKGFDERGKALEDSYFEKKNREALEMLAKKLEASKKLSPVTGKPLKESVLCGVITYICEDSKGCWLEADQLDRLFADNSSEEAISSGVEWDSAFFKTLAEQSKDDIAHGVLKVARESHGARPSPVTGKPMELFELEGIVLDRCPDSGGIWFDANELESLLEKFSSGLVEGEEPSWVRALFKAIGYK